MIILLFARPKRNGFNRASSHAVNPRKEKKVWLLIFQLAPRLKESFFTSQCSSNSPNLFSGGALSRTSRRNQLFWYRSLRILSVSLQAYFEFYLDWVTSTSFQILSNSSSFVVWSSALRIRSCEELWQIHELVKYFKENGKKIALCEKSHAGQNNTVCWLFDLVNILLRIIT
jgi:hypothetical protein